MRLPSLFVTLPGVAQSTATVEGGIVDLTGAAVPAQASRYITPGTFNAAKRLNVYYAIEQDERNEPPAAQGNNVAGFVNLDMALIKRTKLSERRTSQVRAGAFHATDRANFWGSREPISISPPSA